MIDRRFFFVVAVGLIELANAAHAFGQPSGQPEKPAKKDGMAKLRASDQEEADKAQLAYEIKIFPLEFLAPREAMTILEQVFTANNARSQLHLAVDYSSNSIIAKGDHDTLAVVEALLVRLDVGKTEAAPRSKMFSIRLKHMSPSELQLAVQMSGSSDVTSYSDERTNSLILWARDDEIQRIQSLVTLIDVPAQTRAAEQGDDVSVRIIWLLEKAGLKESLKPIPNDLAAPVEALCKKLGINELGMAAQLMVVVDPGESAAIQASGTVELNAPCTITVGGQIKRAGTDRYHLQIHCNTSSNQSGDRSSNLSTECRALAAGRPIILGTTPVESRTSVFIIEVLDK